MSAQDWQPIETIPKDGSIVRGLLDDGSEADITYSKNYWRTTVLVRGVGGGFWRRMVGPYPTHWRRDDEGVAAREAEQAERVARVLRELP